MIALVLAAAAVLAPLQATGVGADLDAGRYLAAHARASAEPDPLVRARELAEVWYRALAPSDALRAAEEGLARAPADPGLLFYAGGAALWLGDARRADRHVAALARAVAALPADERAGWERVVADYRERTDALLAARAARTRAVGRARVVAALGLAASAVALGVLAFRSSS